MRSSTSFSRARETIRSVATTKVYVRPDVGEAVHSSIVSLLITPFDSSSTALDVVTGLDLSDRRVIVTGGASGIGIETVRALAAAGASVTIAVRDVAAGDVVARGLSEGVHNSVVVAALDLTDHDSIQRFCAQWEGPLHALINSAGVMALPELTLSFDGHELQFATNHLGHFDLTVGLHRALADAQGARVVSVSSNAHYFSPVVFEDVDFQRRGYDPWLAYGQSKTANILHAVELTTRWRDDGIVANALHPGAIPTNLQRHTGGMLTPVEHRKTAAQGAATSVLLAVSPLVAGVAGRYFEDCNESPVVAEYVPYAPGVAPFALDEERASRLWELSLRYLDSSRE
jgi:NAD(P)-dependent dehydrogenase (short-subunit alcohol dehydrogenase family)